MSATHPNCITKNTSRIGCWDKNKFSESDLQLMLRDTFKTFILSIIEVTGHFVPFTKFLCLKTL